MNIFVLDENPEIASIWHNDRHTCKMVLEAGQLLCLAHTQTGGTAPYRGSGFKNHPCAIWTRKSINNYRWLCQLGLALCKEYTFRYGRVHKTEQHLIWLKNNEPDLPDIPRTPFVQAMPDDVKNENAVVAYKNYYMKYKRHLAKWKNREVPEWYK